MDLGLSSQKRLSIVDARFASDAFTSSEGESGLVSKIFLNDSKRAGSSWSSVLGEARAMRVSRRAGVTGDSTSAELMRIDGAR